MSIYQTNKDKPRAQKCRHFCFSFDLHNYCPTCREAGKGDDPCITFEMPCDICASFTDDQMKKIQHRKRYLKKQKAETSTKDDELDLLGKGDGDSFTGSNANLESAADNLFTSGAVSDQDLPQHDTNPPYYREVALSDIPSQYAEEVDTYRRILSLPDPRESMPRSSTSVMGLDDEKGCQELRPRGPSSILPLSSVIKDAFDKFQHDFKAANLPEGKYVKPPPSTSKWCRVGQPCFQDKIQELNTDFAKICITPKPSGAPMGKVPLPILKELEHQARQNISTLNFTAAFAKTSSSCNASLEKCQHSIKSTVKKIKSQIQKGANPEKAAKRGYEEVAEYMEFWNKTVLIQHRALTCLSKSLAHILQRELYSMANTGLLRREAEMTLLQPHLGETRCQELRNSSFWDPSLFESQLVKEGEDFLLKKGTSKDSQGFTPYQNKTFRGPHKKRGSYRKRPYGGNSSQSSNQSFSSGRGKPNFRGSRGRFLPHNRGRGHGNPSSQ